MPSGQFLRLGPFSGGLNTSSDPTTIGDAEVIELNNFELDIDGSLISRPPIQEKAGHAGWTERIICIGQGVFSGTHYLIGSNVDGVYYYVGGVWTLITSTTRAAVAVQYSDFVWLIPHPSATSGTGGKWNPSAGFTTVAAIPNGSSASIHKERLYLVPGSAATSNSSRLRFSDAAAFDTWPASSFIDISPGDGTNLVDITVYNDNILLFKGHSTYVLAYDVKPQDAIIRQISNTIGLNKQFNMANYENQVFIFHEGWVYEIVNYDFNRINTKVPFEIDQTTPSAFAEENIFLSLMGDRLICRYYRNVYIYGLRTRRWQTWESSHDNLHYFGPIVKIHPTGGHEYYAGSCVTANKTLLRFYEEHDSVEKEKILDGTVQTITCTVKTKNFDMAVPHQFKKLWWWGADVATNNDIIGRATPITVTFVTTWESLTSSTWGSLGTWSAPLEEAGEIATTINSSTGTDRRFAKFLKALRYRQINFKIKLTTDGSTVDGPAKVFTMMIVTETKQIVGKSVN